MYNIYIYVHHRAYEVVSKPKLRRDLNKQRIGSGVRFVQIVDMDIILTFASEQKRGRGFDDVKR